MSRKYVTTLVLETDEDPQGWRLTDFAGAQERKELDVIETSTIRAGFLTFCCPVCSSSRFKSRPADGTSLRDCWPHQMIGFCSGVIEYATGSRVVCSFSWPRSDDRKYFKE